LWTKTIKKKTGAKAHNKRYNNCGFGVFVEALESVKYISDLSGQVVLADS